MRTSRYLCIVWHGSPQYQTNLYISFPFKTLLLTSRFLVYNASRRVMLVVDFIFLNCRIMIAVRSLYCCFAAHADRASISERDSLHFKYLVMHFRYLHYDSRPSDAVHHTNLVKMNFWLLLRGLQWNTWIKKQEKTHFYESLFPPHHPLHAGG